MSDGGQSNAAPVEFRYLLEQVWGEPRDVKIGPEEMAARRDERVRSIVRFAFERVPWYGSAMRGHGLVPEDFRSADDLALLPLVGHEELGYEGDAFLPRDAKTEGLLELKTSSSTMTARRVYHDPEGIVAGWAVKLRERAIRERLIGERKYRSASLALEGNPTKVQDYLRVIAPAVLKLAGEGRRFSVFEDAARVVEGIREWRPLHLSGYGSALGRLFRYLGESGESMPLPRVITFSSDAMSAVERNTIEKDFGIPVLGIYSATEAFSIGFECGEGEGYHVNEDVSIVRIVDAEGRTAKPGAMGSVIVSNLVNRGTVLLNYRLGDIGSAIDGACPCGRALPRMRLLEGRDTIYIERVEGLPLHQYRLFRALNATGISRWQVVQTAIQSFIVRIIPTPGQDRPGKESEIRAAMLDLLGPGLDIAIEYPPDLERTRTGKVLSIIRR